MFLPIKQENSHTTVNQASQKVEINRLPRKSDATVHMKSEARVTLCFIIYINFYWYYYLRGSYFHFEEVYDRSIIPPIQ